IYLHEPCQFLDGEQRQPDQPAQEFEVDLAELSGGHHLLQRLSGKRGPREVCSFCHHARSRSLPFEPRPIPLGNSRGRALSPASKSSFSGRSGGGVPTGVFLSLPRRLLRWCLRLRPPWIRTGLAPMVAAAASACHLDAARVP